MKVYTWELHTTDQSVRMFGKSYPSLEYAIKGLEDAVSIICPTVTVRGTAGEKLSNGMCIEYTTIKESTL